MHAPTQQRHAADAPQTAAATAKGNIDERAGLLANAAAIDGSSSSSSLQSSISTSSARRAALESSSPVRGSTNNFTVSQTVGSGSSNSGRPEESMAAKAAARHMRLTLLLCLVLVSVGVVQYLDARQLELLIESVRGAPLASMLVFVVLFAAAVVLLVPGMLLSVGSGAAFGLVSGSIVAWLGTVLGQVGAFLLGRYLLRDTVVGYLEKRVSRFKAMDAGISEDGWKLVLLLRLSPVLPYNLMNYALGLTAINLLPYTLASAAAAIPYVCLFAYLGSVSTDLYKLLHDGARAYMTPQLLIGLACIMILSAAGLFFVCRHAVIVAHPGCDGDAQDEANPAEASIPRSAAAELDGGSGGRLGPSVARLAAAGTAAESRSLLPTSVRDVQAGM